VLFESLAARHGFALNLALECDSSLALTKRLVRENCGCTVLPLAAVAEDLAAGTLKSYQLRAPEIRRNVGLVLGNNRVSANRLWETAQLVRNQVRALVESGAWPDARLDAAMQGARPLAGIETATPMPAGA
jgi:DNA-binding transcriptional LysR family regulator